MQEELKRIETSLKRYNLSPFLSYTQKKRALLLLERWKFLTGYEEPKI